MARAKPENPAAPEAPEAEAEGTTVGQFDMWLYHAEEAPRLFRAGEAIPPGWEDSPKAVQ